MTNFSKSKKLLVLGVGIIVLLILSFLWLIKTRVGDIRPIILPPSKDLPKIIEKQNVGEPVDFPLKITGNFKIGIFAKDLGAARDLQVSPEGTLLVSLKNSGTIYALPDKDKDGKADQKIKVLEGLDKPHGLAFHNGKLFVAELRRVSRYFWNEKSLSAKFEKKLFDLPYNGGHSTRSIVVDRGGKIFVSIGSSCNVCVEKDPWLTTVIVLDRDGSRPRVYATGLRNAVFMTIRSSTGQIWATEMGRDWLGDNLPPDEVNILKDGADYGWPYCYAGKTHDSDFDPQGKFKERCKKSTAPVYKIQAHSAPLGLTFIDSAQFPKSWQGDLLVSYHGSWNRSVPTGYKIVRLKVDGNKIPSGEDFITGFLQGSDALGRPVDLEFDKAGSLYISDDKIGVIYKVVKN
ncbi:MAG: PQQ-dependent sugar dehydrogenase [bacterium]|nr:PQQ-dependent sugar dehydrogenase [bacterium]